MKPGEIQIDHLTRVFRVYPQPVRTLKELLLTRGRQKPTDVVALRDVTIHAQPGEALGLIGRNGSGKTTLLRLLAGIIKPTSGRVEAGGRIASLLELGAGFQPEFTGRENVYLNGSIYGLKRSYIREQMDEIVAFAELEHAIDLPVRTYSSGMYMRLGFAVAAHLAADILLLDEVFAVGDEAFQQKCFGKIFEFKRRGGTIVFVSHDAGSVERLCERAVLLVRGSVELDGSTHDAVARYHTLLSMERDPAERKAGLREWGSGEARVAEVELLSGDGDEAAPIFSPASRCPCGCASSPSARSRRRSSATSSVPRPGSCSQRAPRTRASSDGTGRRASGRCASTSTACRSRTAAFSFDSGSPTRRATISTIGSMTPTSSSSTRTAASAASSASRAAGGRRKSTAPPK